MSIIRASGHTFEYVGFGPVNYSTAFPDKQDRAISAEEELIITVYKENGGINFYTGMNDKGISYAGNKKLSTITGREEIFDTPVQTVTGEDISDTPALNITAATEGLFNRAIRVEGGDDNRSSSEFNGPLIVNNKLTVNSDVETNNLFIQGDATVSRKHTVGIATPALAGNPGDVIYQANPGEGSYVGWVYSAQNDWKRFGAVSLNKNANIMTFDGVGVGPPLQALAHLELDQDPVKCLLILMVLALDLLLMHLLFVSLVSQPLVDQLLQQHLLEMVQVLLILKMIHCLSKLDLE